MADRGYHRLTEKSTSINADAGDAAEIVRIDDSGPAGPGAGGPPRGGGARVTIQDVAYVPDLSPAFNDQAAIVDHLLRVVNGGARTFANRMSLVGKVLIEPGRIGVTEHMSSGQVRIVPDGRWSCMNPYVKWRGVFDINADKIEVKNLTIVNVDLNSYGLAHDAARPVILLPGRHVKVSKFFKHLRNVPINSEYIQHGNVHIVQVPQGRLAKIFLENVPSLLQPGTHVFVSNMFTYGGREAANSDRIEHGTITRFRVRLGRIVLAWDDQNPRLFDQPGVYMRDSPNFRFVDDVSAMEDMIQHGTITRYRVKNGRIVLAWEDMKPMMYVEPGVFVKNSANFQYVRDVDAMEDLVRHGTITRFRVKLGQVCLAWENQTPVFFTEPGLYLRDSANFKWVQSIDSSTKFYSLGARKNVTVYNGEVGISYLEGRLAILEPGFHEIEHPNHIFRGFMSTQQRSIDLSTRSGGAFLECETKDLVKVGLKAILIFKIEDPRKAIIEVGDQKAIEPLLLDTAIATLNGIIRSTTLTEVARSTEAPKEFRKLEQEEQEGESHGLGSHIPSAPLFFQRAHDEFLYKLHDRFVSDYGINIVDLRIESFKIIQEELASQISRQAIVTAKTQTELANLEGKREVATAISTREAEVQAIKNQMQSQRIAAETRAKNDAMMATAQTEAQRIVTVAEAKAKAKKIQAEADLEYVRLMSSLPLGKEIALLRMKTEMVTEALRGTNKVVFMDSSNPLAFFQQFLGKIGQIGQDIPSGDPSAGRQ